MTWLGLYGFNNTYALAVSKKVADKYQLKNCSDLAKFQKIWCLEEIRTILKEKMVSGCVQSIWIGI